MDFSLLAQTRQSCRSFDATREVEREKLDRILEVARLAPSACNGQPYFVTVCRGETARAVARSTEGPGMNKFAKDAPILLVISEKPYVATAALGTKLKKNDYRSIDIGILSAYLTAAATEVGLDSCILGWFDDKRIRELCRLDGAVRIVIPIGYAKEGYPLREKKRKTTDALFCEIGGEANDL